MKRFFLLTVSAILLLSGTVSGSRLLEAHPTNTKESYLNEKIVQLADDMAFSKLLGGYLLLLDESSSSEEQKQGYAILEGVVVAMLEFGRSRDEIKPIMQNAARTVATWLLLDADS